jgi:hypothetical protein
MICDWRTPGGNGIGVAEPAEDRDEGALIIEGDVEAVARLFTMFDTLPLMFDVVD